MKKIILTLLFFASISKAASPVELTPPCWAGFIPFWKPILTLYTNTLDINLNGKFQEIDDLLNQKEKEAEQKWGEIGALFDTIEALSLRKMELLRQITALQQSKNIDSQEVIFHLEKEKQLINTYGNIIGIKKDKE